MKRYVSLVSVVALGLLATTASATVTTVTDDFSVAHDYLTQGVAGTIWDGVLNGGAVTVANTTANAGVLTTTLNSTPGYGWDSSHANAPFLYKNVSAAENFTMQVKAVASPTDGYDVAGLLVYMDNSNFVGANANYYNGHYEFRSLASGGQGGNNGETFNASSSTYLKLVYTASTSTFNMFASSDGSDWTAIKYVNTGSNDLVRTDMTGTLKVGIAYADYVPGTPTGQFDNFSLTTGTVPEPSSLALLAAGLVSLLAYAWRKRK